MPSFLPGWEWEAPGKHCMALRLISSATQKSHLQHHFNITYIWSHLQPRRASFNPVNGILPFCSTSTFSNFTLNMLIWAVNNISPLSNIWLWYPNPKLKLKWSLSASTFLWAGHLQRTRPLRLGRVKKVSGGWVQESCWTSFWTKKCLTKSK